MALQLELLKNLIPSLCDLATGFCPQFNLCSNANKLLEGFQKFSSDSGVRGQMSGQSMGQEGKLGLRCLEKCRVLLPWVGCR